MRYNKKLLAYTIGGAVWVSVLGTLLHFAYEWSGSNRIVGLFTPVNESTWEHMKLLFFPMLVYILFEYFQLKEDFPGNLCGGFTGILGGTIAIPILFYGYTSILGRNFMAVDIAIYYISVIIGFAVSYYLADQCEQGIYKVAVSGIIALLAIAFIIFTYNPPDSRIFMDPLKNNVETSSIGNKLPVLFFAAKQTI